MQEFLKNIAKSLVDEPDAVSVTVDEPDSEGMTVFHLNVAPDDVGRIIGKQGKIAKAIRTVMRSAAGKRGMKVHVEIG